MPAVARRQEPIPGFNIDRVAAAAGDDPDVLRMENLDTDLPVPDGVEEATRDAVGRLAANSWLPFDGKLEMKQAVADFIERRSGMRYDPLGEVVITGGDDAMLNALLVTIDPGDEVVVTDPTYAGMVNRVRLASGVPRFAPLVPSEQGWRLDLDGLAAAVTDRTRAVFVMSPSLPSGWVASREEWDAIADLCRRHELWLISMAWWEGMVFDGLPVISAPSLPDIRDTLIVAGSVSLEQRMIGWRIGWTVGPERIRGELSKTQIYNALVPSGILQAGARVALSERQEDLAEIVAELQRRRDETLRQLEGFPVIPSAGGWSLLMDTAELGIDCADASKRMLEQKVAATQMRGWGDRVAERYLRFVYSREPLERLALLGERARAALG